MAMQNARSTTLNPEEYKIPNIKVIPLLHTTLVRGKFGAAPFQSKEIGESDISQVAPAIAHAVYDAIGIRIMDLPITAEKVFRALQARRTEDQGTVRR